MLAIFQFAVGAAAALLAMRQRRIYQQALRLGSATLETLLNAIDANDEETGHHVRRVAQYALELADAADLSEHEKRSVERVALFHDIGKIHEALFDILHDASKLSPEERKIVMTHPHRGAKVLAPLEAFYPDLPAGVLAHHERWDGTGYPHGMAGEAIPLAARIFAVADVWDALVHARPYRKAWSVVEVTRHLESLAGSHLDPNIVEVFLTLVREGKIDPAEDLNEAPPITLLVVDDTEGNLRLITRWLERDGYRVLTARNGFEALAAIEEALPDLVVLDVTMPGPSGLQVCEAIKSSARSAHLPVVLLTGTALSDERRAATRADAILEKPAAPATLKAVISRLLALRQAAARSPETGRGARI